MIVSRSRFAALAVVTASLATTVSCRGDDAQVSLTLVVYDSFPTADTPLNAALAEFAADTGISVSLAVAGDAGTMVSKAVLTSGNPEGDVMWGVDNTLLSAAVDGGVFDGDPTAVDTGDVCVNYDIEWFADRGVEPPTTLDDLIDPQYADLLVVENPSTSSPGLAFLLATVAGTDDWKAYWSALRANGVEVVDSWTTAYYDRFSGAGGGANGGDRPLVVSYASSPPAEVVYADPPRDDAPTGVSTGTCFRQTEYAGVLRGTDHVDAARQLVDFLVSERFQRELPLTLFVNPVNPDVALPDVYQRFAVVPDAPFTVPPEDIAANRDQWQDEWTDIVLR
ncbi:MAG: thiamine ABC transporter substrate-binding protein [Ilumatobacteraceae bacterium]